MKLRKKNTIKPHLRFEKLPSGKMGWVLRTRSMVVVGRTVNAAFRIFKEKEHGSR